MCAWNLTTALNARTLLESLGPSGCMQKLPILSLQVRNLVHSRSAYKVLGSGISHHYYAKRVFESVAERRAYISGRKLPNPQGPRVNPDNLQTPTPKSYARSRPRDPKGCFAVPSTARPPSGAVTPELLELLVHIAHAGRHEPSISIYLQYTTEPAVPPPSLLEHTSSKSMGRNDLGQRARPDLIPLDLHLGWKETGKGGSGCKSPVQ